MAWKVFTGKGSKGDFLFPVVTVHRTGTIALNDRAFEAMGEPAALSLLYDDDDPTVVAFQPMPSGQYKPRKSSDGRTWIIAAGSFLRFLGHAATETQRFRAQIEDGGTMVVRLKEPLERTRPSRRRTADQEVT